MDPVILITSIIGGVASLSFLILGFILLDDWKKRKFETLFHWGFGFILWSITLLLEIIGFYIKNDELFFSQHLLEGFSFIIFFMYGTLVLLLSKSSAKIISGIYFFIFFLADLYLIVMQQNSEFLLWHSVLFLLPSFLILSYYYHKYQIKLQEHYISRISHLWFMLAFLYSIKLAIEYVGYNNYVSYLFILIFITIFMLFKAYIKVIKNPNIWELLLNPHQKKINQSFVDYFTELYGKDTLKLVELEMDRLGITDMYKAEYDKKLDFVENIISHHLVNKLSLQKQHIARPKMMHLLGVFYMDTSNSKDFSIS